MLRRERLQFLPPPARPSEHPTTAFERGAIRIDDGVRENGLISPFYDS
jgi:acetyl/propionyl-CoA carboxylase alpha subunit